MIYKMILLNHVSCKTHFCAKPDQQSLGLPWSPKRPSRFCTGVLAVLEHLRAVDKHILYADRQLVWVFKCGPVSYGLWIEHDHICKHAWLEKAAMIEPVRLPIPPRTTIMTTLKVWVK